MSTRSLIMRHCGDKVESIYCHWDGYPEHHAPILTQHYDTDEKVAALLRLGDLSVLGTEIGREHDFDLHGCGETHYQCLAYGRDRGENGTSKRRYANPDNAIKAHDWVEYAYLFKHGKWRYKKVDDDKWTTI